MKRYSWMMMAVIILLVGLISLDAQPNQKRNTIRRHALMGHFRSEMTMCRELMERKEELKLTGQQIAGLKKKGYEFERVMIDSRAALQKEELEMRNLMDNDKLTKEQALAQQKKIQQIRNDMENKRLILKFDILSELTAEQKEKLESIQCGKGDRDGRFGRGGMHRLMDHPEPPDEPGRSGMPGREYPHGPKDKPDQDSGELE